MKSEFSIASEKNIWYERPSTRERVYEPSCINYTV